MFLISSGGEISIPLLDYKNMHTATLVDARWCIQYNTGYVYSHFMNIVTTKCMHLVPYKYMHILKFNSSLLYSRKNESVA
jgi:hypothetical protein